MDFSDCIESLGHTDTLSSSAYFIWSNKRTVGFLAKKLDKILGNEVWLDSFPNVVAEFTPPDFSDHSAGVLKFEPPILKKSSFKFFNYLTKHNDFLHTVKDCWVSTSVYGTHMIQL